MRRLIPWCLLAGTAVLALLPAYSELTEPAQQRQVCTANLTALYRATQAYAADNDGYFPFAQVRMPPPHVWLWWYDFTRPYLQDPRVFCCPASAKAEEYDVYAEPEPLLPGQSFSPYWVSYGMGYWFAKDHDPRAPYRPAALRDVHSTSLFADARGQLISPNRGGWDVDARHEGRVNAVLADGAVVLAKPEYRANGEYVLKRVSDGKALVWQTVPE